MTPGRELDALIQEKVLGYLAHSADPPGPYSTEIGWAWEILEKFPTFTLEKNAKGKFICAIQGKFISASTAPAAICLAALEAVGHSLS